jgi:hypothetical protein
MVSPSENPPHVKRSPSAAMVITDEATIETSRGKARCKAPNLACQLSVFLAPVRYRVVKTVHSYSKVVLGLRSTLWFILVQAPP